LISIVIPAFNEEASIRETIHDLVSVLSGMGQQDSEIIIVDDGSSDKTAEIAKQAGARVIQHPHNVGYGAALKSGIREARYETIVISDADKTYPVDRLPELISRFQEGYDMVVGARTGAHYRQSLGKALLRNILTFLVEFTSGRRVPDVNSGFRVFNRDTIQQYFLRLCDTFSFTTSATLAYMMNGRFVAYVEIPYGARKGASKVKLLRDSMRTLEYIILAATYYNPIKLFSLFSIICILFSIAGFIVSALFKINGGYFLGIGGILVALLIFSLGLLASLLKQIMDK